MKLVASLSFFTSRSETLPAYKAPWVQSPGWDGFWLHSALWLVPLTVLLDHTAWSRIYLLALFAVWIAHRFASAWLVFGTSAYAPLRSRDGIRLRNTLLGVVVLVGVGIFLSGHILPFNRGEALLGLLLLDFALSLHHYAKQHYGLLQLYRRPTHSGIQDSGHRDQRFCNFVVGAVAFAEILHGTSFLQDSGVLGYEFFTGVVDGGTAVGCLAVVGGTCWGLWRNRNRSLPNRLYLGGLGLLGVSAFVVDPILFLMAWTMQHWLANLGLVVAMSARDGKTLTNNRTLNRQRLGFTLAGLVLISVILSPILDVEGAVSTQNSPLAVLPELAAVLAHEPWLGFATVLALSSGFAHYYLDRVAFRMRDPLTRNCVRSLLNSKNEHE
jgi:hypothetical protein